MNNDHPPAARAGITGRAHRFLVFALLTLTTLLCTAAQAFNPDANALLRSAAIQPDGRIVITGVFTSVGGITRNSAARLNPDGSVDLSFGDLAGEYSLAAAVQADGKVLVGGKGVNGFGGLARINPDGSVDASFVDAFGSDASTAWDNRVRSIVPLADGKILIGGNFAIVGGQPRNKIARLNADGSLDTSFDPGSNVPGEVYRIAVQADGRVLVGGINVFVRLLGDGAADTGAPVPSVSANTIGALTVQPDGKILLGGWNPLQLNGTTYGRLARLNEDGSVDTSFQPPAEVGGIYAPLGLLADGRIVISNGPGGNVTRLLPGGGVDPGFSGPGIGSATEALALQADGKIVVGGFFNSIHGLSRGNIARLHADGRLDNGAAGPLTVTAVATNGSISPSGPQPIGEGATRSFTLTPDPGHVLATATGCSGTRIGNIYTTGFIWADCTVVATFIDEDDVYFDPDADGSVEKIVVQSDGRIVVGGAFTRIGGLPQAKVARLNPTAGAAEPDYVQLAPNGMLYGLGLQADGKMLLGTRNEGIKRVNADGSLDPGFSVTFSGNSAIYAMAAQSDGKIVVGGTFTTVNGVARNNIARLNSDGSLDEGFNPGVGANNTVYAIVVEPDGRIVIGGGFTQFAGGAKRGLARLNADGSADPTFPAAATIVYALHRDDDGRYLVGGFGNINLGDGVPADSRLIRMLPSGTRDLAFEANVQGPVRSIAIQPDGNVVIGGEFTTVNDQNRSRLARLGTDGTLDSGFDIAVNGRVSTVALQADGKLLIGGAFTAVGAYARQSIARLTADGRIDVVAFTVTPYVGANGTITPNAPQAVGPGETTQFTIVPDPGYVIGAVDGCGGSLDGLVYTTGPIAAHCTVTVDFLLDVVTYTVTPAVDAHGTLTPAMPQSVLFAQTASFDVAAEPGYFLDTIGGCGGSLSGTIYTTGRILADCTISAGFARPDGLLADGGSGQTTAVDTTFGQPLSVRVTDAGGGPIAGVEVAFAPPASGAGATLSATTATSDADGIARVSARANGVGGSYSVVASAAGLSAAFALRNESLDHGGIELEVTVGTDPAPACGTQSVIEAVAGTQLNYCFTVVNRSDITLNYHTLTMATFGHPYQYSLVGKDRLFHRLVHALAPGERYQYNRLITVGAQTQTPKFTWTAAATLPGYEFDSGSDVAFTDISASGTAVPLGMQGNFDLVELPFPITFYGQTFLDQGVGRLCINNSGTLRLQRGADDSECPRIAPFDIPPFMGDNTPLAAPLAEGMLFERSTNFILPYWDLLGSNGMVYYETLGAAPNRRLLVQWQDKDHGEFPNPSQGITFQVVIEETTGKIHYVYQSLNFDVVATPNPDLGGSATVGLVGYRDHENPLEHLEFSFDSPVLAAGQSISWTPTDMPRYASSDVLVEVGTPRLALDPGAIHASTPTGASTTQVLNLRNDGNLNLEWSMQEAEAQAHFPPVGVRYAPSPESQAAGTVPLPGVGIRQNWFEPSSFDVPAYGFALETAYTYPVSFDASNPLQFVHAASVGNFGGIYAGDFVGDDFSRSYVFNTNPDSDFSFSTVDVATGAYTPIAWGPDAASPVGWNQPPYPRWSGLAWDRTTDTLFASTTGGERCDSGYASDLYTIDVATGTPTRIGPIDIGGDICIADVAVGPDGAMYGIDTRGNTLVAIDKTSGAAVVVGWLGFDLIDTGPHSLDFDDAGDVLYLAAGHLFNPTGGMFTVDRVTGLASLVGPFPIEPISGFGYFSLLGLSIATTGGECADPAQVPWLTLNQIAGVLTPGSHVAVQVGLDASGLVPGRYEAQLCVFSNDRSRSLARVPVSLTVTDGTDNSIFADSFEVQP